MSITESFYTSGDYWKTRLGAASDYKVALALRALAAANLKLAPGVRAAEIGCGNGAFLFPLTKTLDAQIGSFALYGFDISTLAIDQARKVVLDSGENRLFFRLGSAADVHEQFDVAFLMDVVEHVTDPYAFLSSVRNIAPLVVMHLPIEHSIAHRLLHKPTKAYKQFHHVHFFSLETMRILLDEVGFEIVSVQFTAASPEIWRFSGSVTTRASRALRYYAYKVSPNVSSIFFGGSVMVIMRPKMQPTLQ